MGLQMLLLSLPVLSSPASHAHPLTHVFPVLEPGSPTQPRECSTCGMQEAALYHPAAPALPTAEPSRKEEQQEGDLLPKQPPTAPAAWPRLELTKNLWGREEQSTVVPTHSPIIILCFTSSIICLDTRCHAASCDHRQLAVPLLENFPFSLPKYF